MKKVVIALVVLFLGFYLVTDPGGLAHLTKAASGAAWHGTTSLFHVVIRFLNSLFA